MPAPQVDCRVDLFLPKHGQGCDWPVVGRRDLFHAVPLWGKRNIHAKSFLSQLGQAPQGAVLRVGNSWTKIVSSIPGQTSNDQNLPAVLRRVSQHVKRIDGKLHSLTVSAYRRPRDGPVNERQLLRLESILTLAESSAAR